jgi:hypothetical protein
MEILFLDTGSPPHKDNALGFWTKMLDRVEKRERKEGVYIPPSRNCGSHKVIDLVFFGGSKTSHTDEVLRILFLDTGVPPHPAT